MEIVTVTISKNGADVKVDANGFVGSSCADFTKPLIKALGVVTYEEKKPEFYQNNGAGVRVGA